MRKLLALTMLMAILSACKHGLSENDTLLEQMLARDPDRFKYILEHKDELEVQIIYTQINRDANNRPAFRSFYFNVDSSCYFYPASTVKLPMALMALEKLNRLNIPYLDKFTPMFNDSVYSGQFSATRDTTSANCLPSIGQYVKKLLVVSDNDAHNRLYEFMGQKDANEIMQDKNYVIRILQRVDRALSPDENRHTEAVRFTHADSVIYSQPMLVGDSIVVSESVLRGAGFIRHDTLFQSPMDFTYKNFYPLTSQQRVLRALLFPESVPPEARFDLRSEDRKFVLKYMSQLPTETYYPPYACDSIYNQTFGKYLMFGDGLDSIPEGIRVFNKIGNAYGYLIDNAYIVDFTNNVEFMLSAVISTNSDQIYNDGKYEYHEIGFPFMRDLGLMIYNYEVQRPRKFMATLDEFRMEYDVMPDGFIAARIR